MSYEVSKFVLSHREQEVNTVSIWYPKDRKDMWFSTCVRHSVASVNRIYPRRKENARGVTCTRLSLFKREALKGGYFVVVLKKKRNEKKQYYIIIINK